MFMFCLCTYVYRELRLSLLQFSHWTVVDKHFSINSITAAQLLAFAEAFKSQLFVEGLVQGNVTTQVSISLSIV